MAKVGLGLWNHPTLAFALEAVLLFGGMSLFLRGRPEPKIGMILFGMAMLGIQAGVFFGPPPPSDRAAALTAFLSYGVFAAFVARWEVSSPSGVEANDMRAVSAPAFRVVLVTVIVGGLLIGFSAAPLAQHESRILVGFPTCARCYRV